MKMKMGLLVILVILTSACNMIQEEPRIDASSLENATASLQHMKASLSSDELVKFDEALQAVAGQSMGMAFLQAMGGASEQDIGAQLFEPLDGKTAIEVINEGNRILAERNQREREQARQEVAELEAKMSQSEAARSQLARFEVTRSRFYKRDRKYSGAQPIIELSVRNNTKHAISRAYFQGVLDHME